MREELRYQSAIELIRDQANGGGGATTEAADDGSSSFFYEAGRFFSKEQ
jgi:hypothetical protein